MFDIRKRSRNNVRLCSTRNSLGFFDPYVITLLCVVSCEIILIVTLGSPGGHLSEMFLMYKNTFLLGILSLLCIALTKLTYNMYHQVYVKTKNKCVQADISIEDENALEELICHNVTEHDTRNSEKSVQTNITMIGPKTDTTLPKRTIENVRDYDIPNKIWTVPELTQEEIEKYDTIRASIGAQSFIALKGSKHKRSQSASSVDSGVAKTLYTEAIIMSDLQSEQDPLEKIGPSTSGFIEKTDTKSEDNNTKTSLTDTSLSIVDLYQSTPF